MAVPRESTFLPTIKCSSCGNAVPISLMGDHICAGSNAECTVPCVSSSLAFTNQALVSPPLEASEQLESRLGQYKSNKYARTPPPLEMGSDGQTFLHRGQLTPVSLPGDSRHVSPVKNPTRPGRLDGFFQPEKPKMTAPVLSAAPESSPSYSSHQPRVGGYGGFNSPQEVDPSYAEESSAAETSEVLAPATGNRGPTAPKKWFPQRKESLDKWVPPPDGFDMYNRVPPTKGYDAYDSQNDGQFGGIKRSDTYPELNASVDAPARNPSEPGRRPEHSRRVDYSLQRKKSMGPDTSRRPPPRTSLLSDTASRKTGSLDLVEEFGSRNPYHTPTDSMSSGYSNFSAATHYTASTSPDRSAHPYVEGGFQEPAQGLGFEGHQQHASKPSKPQDLRIDAAAASANLFIPALIESPYGPSPLDERFNTEPGYGQQQPRNQASQPNWDRRNERSMGRYEPSPTREQNDWLYSQRQPEPAPLPSRGDCRACGLAITGKSISSADGRLTGKYHKACFVCTTCRHPFTSSVFYVINDQPYCEHHYHKLNGSLCGDCNKGIEGQYVEDESQVKYHVKCFCCIDCGCLLTDGYFEVGGLSLCERDAWQRVQANSYPEPEPAPAVPETETQRYQYGVPRGAYGARMPPPPPPPPPTSGPVGLPSRPNHPNSKPQRSYSSKQKLKMNKRMTRMGNFNI